jgi:hypothetical protein
MKRETIALAWSGGKDSALSLLALHESGFEVGVLLTTVTQDYNRISIHGVRRVLLEQQAATLGVALEIALIPPHCSNDDYERSFGEALQRCRERGISKVAAGDLFLKSAALPRKSAGAARNRGAFSALGPRHDARGAGFHRRRFQAILSCVDTFALDASSPGAISTPFAADLPATADTVRRKRRFHSFVWKGRFSLSRRVLARRSRVRDERSLFCDLLPSPELRAPRLCAVSRRIFALCGRISVNFLPGAACESRFQNFPLAFTACCAVSPFVASSARAQERTPLPPARVSNLADTLSTGAPIFQAAFSDRSGVSNRLLHAERARQCCARRRGAVAATFA